jgi:hypothetical protein
MTAYGYYTKGALQGEEIFMLKNVFGNDVQRSLDDLFGVVNLATILAVRLREAATVILGNLQEIDDPALMGGQTEGFDIIDRMTPKELMFLAGVEDERHKLRDAWRRIENEKQGIIHQARTRIADQGRETL